ncbi:MAG: hypothetical protein NTX70_09290 [Verrucomicrobia bacterium]|nr:hypothetical protein [Verrucomicrobiota bacterium]
MHSMRFRGVDALEQGACVAGSRAMYRRGSKQATILDVPCDVPDAGIDRIADTLTGWKEEGKLSRIVDHAELKKIRSLKTR